jgi:hypothetical protein
MKAYDDSWDRPHAPAADAMWQESDWLTFYDPDVKVGATYRVGRQPNRGKAQPSLFCFAEAGERFYLQDVGGRGLDSDTRPEDLWENGCRVAGHTVEALGAGRMRFAWNYPDTEAELEFGDSFYTPRGWNDTDAGRKVMSWLNPDGHLECAGRLRGSVRIGDQTYAIDCFAHRDRSWGYRENYMSKLRRAGGAWGSNGRGLSFASTLLDVRRGDRVPLGFVVRNGREEDVLDLRYLSVLDEDLASPVGGIILFRLADGEEIRLRCDLVQGFGGYVPGVCFSALGSFVYEGERGFCNFSANADPGAASRRMRPDDVTLLSVEPGLTKVPALPFSRPLCGPATT